MSIGILTGIGVVITGFSAVIAWVAVLEARHANNSASAEAAKALKSATAANTALIDLKEENARAAKALEEANDIARLTIEEKKMRKRGILSHSLAMHTSHIIGRYRLNVPVESEKVAARREALLAVSSSQEPGSWLLVTLLHLFSERARAGIFAENESPEHLIMVYADSWTKDPAAFDASFSQKEKANIHSELSEYLAQLKAATEQQLNELPDWPGRGAQPESAAAPDQT